MNIGNQQKKVYVVRVQTPNDMQIEVDLDGTTGLKKAIRTATAIAGWLAVDKWEPASRFIPEGVREIAEDVVACCPDVDLSKCTVLVLHRDPNSTVHNGYSLDAAFQVGAIVPNMLRSLREESQGGDVRKDSGHKSPRPHITQDRITQSMFDEIPFSNSDNGSDGFGF